MWIQTLIRNSFKMAYFIRKKTIYSKVWNLLWNKSINLYFAWQFWSRFLILNIFQELISYLKHLVPHEKIWNIVKFKHIIVQLSPWQLWVSTIIHFPSRFRHLPAPKWIIARSQSGRNTWVSRFVPPLGFDNKWCQTTCALVLSRPVDLAFSPIWLPSLACVFVAVAALKFKPWCESSNN